MKRIVELTIGPDGGVKIETSGFTGGDCIKTTSDLESAIGVTSNRNRKKEFYEKQKTKSTNRLKQG